MIVVKGGKVLSHRDGFAPHFKGKFLYDWRPLRTFFSHNFGTFLKFSEKIQGEVTRTGYWTPKQLKIVKRLMQSGAV